MRIRLPYRRLALFGLMLMLMLPFAVPLRLALGAIGAGGGALSARAAEGGLWSGRLVEARLGPLAIGDVGARLAFWPLFLGRARIALSRDAAGPGDAPLTGAVTATFNGHALDDVTARLPASGAFAPLPIGMIDLADVSVAFRDGLCQRAEGRVRAELGGEAALLGLPASLAGDARCDGGALVLPLVSQSGADRMTIRIEGTGRYRAELIAQPVDPVMRDRLVGAGFAAGPRGLGLSISGGL